MLKFWASAFSVSSFLFTNSIKHLKIALESTQVCPWFVHIHSWLSAPSTGILRCFPESGKNPRNLRRGWLKTATFEISYNMNLSGYSKENGLFAGVLYSNILQVFVKYFLSPLCIFSFCISTYLPKSSIRHFFHSDSQ